MGCSFASPVCSSTADLSFSGIADNSMQFAAPGGMRALSPPSLGGSNSTFAPAVNSSSVFLSARLIDESGPAAKKARSSQNAENAGLGNLKARTNLPSAGAGDVFSSRANQTGGVASRASKTVREPERRSTRIRTNAVASASKTSGVKVGGCFALDQNARASELIQYAARTCTS